MKVAELIKRLQDEPEDLEVAVYDGMGTPCDIGFTAMAVEVTGIPQGSLGFIPVRRKHDGKQ